VTSVESSAVVEPYDDVVPYSTCGFADSSVVHVIVADVMPGVPDEIDEIEGAVVSGEFAGGEAELPPPIKIICPGA
jgi:hypothetical protein